MMGPDIAKGANTQVSAQTCHQDGGNQVRKSISLKEFPFNFFLKIFLYTTGNKIHFDEYCLEPANGKPNTNRNIIFDACGDEQTEQNWKYNEQVCVLIIEKQFPIGFRLFNWKMNSINDNV